MILLGHLVVGQGSPTQKQTVFEHTRHRYRMFRWPSSSRGPKSIRVTDTDSHTHVDGIDTNMYPHCLLCVHLYVRSSTSLSKYKAASTRRRVLTNGSAIGGMTGEGLALVGGVQF